MANDVNLKIGADTKSAEKSIDSLSNGLKGLQKIAAAAAAIFAGKQVLDFFNEGTQAAIAQEKAMAALSQQLKLSGDFTDDALKSFAAFADQMELTSQFGDDVVLSQTAVAKAMGLTNEQSKDLVQAAIELSAATGDSLDASVQALGKTFDGITGKSPVLKNALQGISTESLKAGEGIKAVLQNLGGSSEAQIQTFAGSLTQAKNAFGNLQESFGTIIIENPALIAGIKAFTEGFRQLQSQVEQSSGLFSDFITSGIQGLAVAISVGVDAIGFLIIAFQGTATVLSLAVSGFLTLADAIGSTLALSLGNAVTLVLKLSDALGFTDGAAEKFEGFVDAQIEGLRRMTDSTLQFAAENNQSFEEFNKTYEDFQGTVEGLAQTVFEAGESQIKTQQKVLEQTKKTNELSAAEMEKLQSDFKSFYEKMESGAVESLDGQLNAYERYLDEFDRLKDSGVFSQEKTNKLLENIQRSHQQKITDIVKKETEDRQKQISTTLSDTNIFQQIKLSLDPNAPKDLQAEIKKNIKGLVVDIAASAVGAVANGAAGADAVTQLVTGLISKIPVFGGLIAELIKLAAQAPEENKKNIQGFAKGIPEFLSNINTNLGSLTTILNEVIGPIIEQVLTSSGIGNLFVNLFRNIIKLPELIKTIALGVRDGIRGNGAEISDAFKKASVDTKAELIRIRDGLKNFFGTFAQQIVASVALGLVTAVNGIKSGVNLLIQVRDFFGKFFEGIGGFFTSIKATLEKIAAPVIRLASSFETIADRINDGFIQVKQSIGSIVTGVSSALFQIRDSLSNAFRTAIEFLGNRFTTAFDFLSTKVQSIIDFFGTIISSIGGFFSDLGAKFTDGFLQVRDQIASLFTGIADAFKSFPGQIRDALSDLFNGIKDAIQNAFSGDKLKPITGKLGGASGGTNILSGKIPGFASGITEVPGGFNDDSFVARLSSGERVVPSSTNEDLKEFLENSRNGGLGNDQMIALLSDISSKLGSGGPSVIEVTVDKKVLGRTILDLNRRNERINA